ALGRLFEKPVEPLKERTSTALVEIRNRLQQAKRLEAALDEPDRARIAALSANLAREITSRRERAVAQLQRGLGKSPASKPRLASGTSVAAFQSDVDYSMGLAGVMELAPLLPDDAELQRWAVLSETFPKVTLYAADGSHGERVAVRAIDPFNSVLG